MKAHEKDDQGEREFPKNYMAPGSYSLFLLS